MTPTRFALLVAALIAGVRLFCSLYAQNNAVSVAWVFPAPGTTISNTVALEVTASSSTAPIARVEFYDVFTSTNGVTTTNFIGVVTNKFPPLTNVNVY